MKSLRSITALSLVLSLSACMAKTSPMEGSGDPDADEDMAAAEQPLIGYLHNQAFGAAHGTPGFAHYDRFGSAVAAGDLNNDGATDLVVGAPNLDYGDVPSAGAVKILWGQKINALSFGGLSNTGITTLYQPGAGNPENGDDFGSSIAIGDFNCDGYKDIAVGDPSDTPSSAPFAEHAGNVSILYGPTFTSSSWQLFWQGSATAGTPEINDYFGATLAVGNFNGDTYGGHACDDLAVSAPGESVGSAASAGAVIVLYGRSTGLNTAGAPAAQMLHQDIGTITGVAEDSDWFGASLAAGDFNHDGKDDLAIGAPGESYELANGLKQRVGVVHILKGSATGITDVGNDLLELDDFAAIGLQPEGNMGSALAAGDFDWNGITDLAVGVPGLNVGGAADAGGVVLYRQTGGALTASLTLKQGSSGIAGAAEAGDRCGASLATGDFIGGEPDGVAMGCPNEDVVALNADEGALTMVYFTVANGGFQVSAGQVWHQDSSGILDSCGNGDTFGEVLASGDFNGDGRMDLAAGAPNDDSTTIVDAGTVNVLYGAP